MLKLIGAVMIIVSGAAWGFLQSERLKKRTEELEKLISALGLLENDIAYGKRDIKTALYSIGRLQDVKLFCSAAENMDSVGIKNAFLSALDTHGEYLSGTDKEAAAVLADNLGMTDSSTQIKCIRHTVGILKTAHENAVCEYEKSGKLYRGIGVLAGLAAVILLF
ncbi:MAG: stage III sporulation protein AB [Clostridia bacterium]|nr:stage III sporulation protein AB [Clostridia bacterium]